MLMFDNVNPIYCDASVYKTLTPRDFIGIQHWRTGEDFESNPGKHAVHPLVITDEFQELYRTNPTNRRLCEEIIQFHYTIGDSKYGISVVSGSSSNLAKLAYNRGDVHQYHNLNDSKHRTYHLLPITQRADFEKAAATLHRKLNRRRC
jgi:hypothetical protein